MARIALDSNVLVYVELEPESAKGRRARSIITRIASNCVLPAQALGELLNVVRRKKPAAIPEARLQVIDYRDAMATPSTTIDAIVVAAELVLERKLQFWDSVICVVAAQAGATYIFSEDMQDGADIRGLKIVNPFDAKNDALIEKILGA